MVIRSDSSDNFLYEEFSVWEGEPMALHGNQAFYQSFLSNSKSYKVGDIFYVRHLEDFERMSFLEIYMLWELRDVKYMSLRAFYFPEDTVEGRFPEQGQDEVLCLDGEVVMSCAEFLRHIAFTHSESKDLPVLKILSFPGYCRCCAMRQRLGPRLEEFTSHPLFRALGGVLPKYRVLFCRETVRDKELYQLWKCQDTYREVPNRQHSFSRKRLKINNTDSYGIQFGKDDLNGRNNVRKRKKSISKSKASLCVDKDDNDVPVMITSKTENDLSKQKEDDLLIDVEDTNIHSVISSAGKPLNKMQPEPSQADQLLQNVTSIKLPCLSTQTSPQQLDVIVKQLSQKLSRLKESKNNQRGVQYLMKQ